MWILQFLPFWIFYTILFVGVIVFASTYLIKFIPIPAIYLYKTPLQIISMFLIVIGVYMSGSIANENSWLLKVKDLEIKVAQAEAKSQEVNVKIVEKFITKTQIVREKGAEIVRYVDKEIVKYDSKCEVPKEAISAINKAAESISK